MERRQRILNKPKILSEKENDEEFDIGFLEIKDVSSKKSNLCSEEDIIKYFDLETELYEETANIIYNMIDEFYPNGSMEFKFLVFKRILLDRYGTSNVTSEELNKIITSTSNPILEPPRLDLGFDGNLIKIYLYEENIYTRFYIPSDIKVVELTNKLSNLLKTKIKLTKKFKVLKPQKTVVSEIGIDGILTIEEGLYKERLFLSN